MALDRNAFIDNFVDELKENVDMVDAKILALKKDPENDQELNALLRGLHTIKGSSRMLKFGVVEGIAHGLENVFKGVKEQRYEISKQLIQLVFITTDYLREGMRRISVNKNDEMDTARLLKVFSQVYENEPYSLEGLKSFKKENESGEEPVSASEVTAVVPADREVMDKDLGKVVPAKKIGTVTEQETIRIKISKVDKIIKSLNRCS